MLCRDGSDVRGYFAKVQSIVYHQRRSDPIYIKKRTEDSTVLKTLKQEYYYNHRDVYHADFSISKHTVHLLPQTRDE
jgi:hypothetical protein